MVTAVATGHEFCLNPLHPGPCEGWKEAKRLGLDHTKAHPNLVPKRRRRAKAEPAATVKARIRQQQIDDSRAASSLVAELEERAILNEEEDPEVLQRALQQIVDRDGHGIEGDESIDRLLEMARWGDRRDMVMAMRAVANRWGLERIGGVEGRPLQKVDFNPKEHQAIDGRPNVGQRVQVVRPGFYGNINGEKVLLSKALVEATDPDVAPSAAGDDVDWPARLASGIKSVRGLSNSDNYSKVDLVTFNDGSRAVRKTGKTWPGDNWPATMVQEHDAEELGAMVAREMSLNPPGVYRATPDEAYFDYIDDDMGQLGMDIVGWGRPVPPALTDSVWGRRMGLLDVITENRDRNDGNWFGADEAGPMDVWADEERELIPIDHGLAFSAPSSTDPELVETTSNPFSYHYVDGALGQWKDNDLSPAYVASLRDGLAALKPQFVQRGRGLWHGRMMQRLAMIQRHARGDRYL